MNTQPNNNMLAREACPPSEKKKKKKTRKEETICQGPKGCKICDVSVVTLLHHRFIDPYTRGGRQRPPPRWSRSTEISTSVVGPELWELGFSDSGSPLKKTYPG